MTFFIDHFLLRDIQNSIKAINEGTAEAQAIINLTHNVKDAAVNNLINARIANYLNYYLAKVNDLFTLAMI